MSGTHRAPLSEDEAVARAGLTGFLAGALAILFIWGMTLTVLAI